MELMQVSESIHRKHFDLTLEHIYQLAVSSLFDVIKDRVKKESIPGALHNKTYAAVLKEKGVLNKSDKNSHKDFLRSVNMYVTQPETDSIEIIWQLFKRANLTEEEIFILVVSEQISFDRYHYKSWVTNIKDYMDSIDEERIKRGILNWKMKQIAKILDKKTSLVFETRNTALNKMRKLVHGNRYI